MIVVSIVTLADDLQQLVEEINRASWDDANDIAVHDAAALSIYLERQDTLFAACHDVAESGRTLLGIASARRQSCASFSKWRRKPAARRSGWEPKKTTMPPMHSIGR